MKNLNESAENIRRTEFRASSQDCNNQYPRSWNNELLSACLLAQTEGPNMERELALMSLLFAHWTKVLSAVFFGNDLYFCHPLTMSDGVGCDVGHSLEY